MCVCDMQTRLWYPTGSWNQPLVDIEGTITALSFPPEEVQNVAVITKVLRYSFSPWPQFSFIKINLKAPF